MAVQGLFNEDSVENLKNVLIKFTVELDAFGASKASESKRLNLAESTFNKLLYRTRLNIEGIISMLDIYKTQPAMIHPIVHVVRSLQVDFLNFCYLMSFYNSEESNLKSFSNELDHFDRDFLKSAKELAQVEADLPKHNPNFKGKSPDEEHQRLQALNLSYKHLYKNEDVSGKLKLSKELRATSATELFDSIEERGRPGNGMLSEKYKYERLINRGYKKYADAYLLYKYFSQQYHFSNISNLLLSPDVSDHNFFYLVWAMNHVLLVTDMQIQILDGKESKFLEPMRKLEKELENSLKTE